MAQLEPLWTLRIQEWWQNLLGPTLTGAWNEIKKVGSAPSALVKAHGVTVQTFVRELAKLGAEVDAFVAETAGTEWAPFAAKAKEVHSSILAQWRMPESTRTEGVEGVLDPVASVMRIGNTAVTAVGMAWAIGSLAHVTHARRTVAKWREHAAEGVHPSRRETRQAGIEGFALDDTDLVVADLVGARLGRGRRRRRRRRRRGLNAARRQQGRRARRRQRHRPPHPSAGSAMPRHMGGSPFPPRRSGGGLIRRLGGPSFVTESPEYASEEETEWEEAAEPYYEDEGIELAGEEPDDFDDFEDLDDAPGYPGEGAELQYPGEGDFEPNGVQRVGAMYPDGSYVVSW